MTYAKITDKKNLVRDIYSKAILNTDLSVVKKHEQRILSLQKEEVRQQEINTLKAEMLEIKALLQQLVNK